MTFRLAPKKLERRRPPKMLAVDTAKANTCTEADPTNRKKKQFWSASHFETSFGNILSPKKGKTESGKKKKAKTVRFAEEVQEIVYVEVESPDWAKETFNALDNV